MLRQQRLVPFAITLIVFVIGATKNRSKRRVRILKRNQR